MHASLMANAFTVGSFGKKEQVVVDFLDSPALSVC